MAKHSAPVVYVQSTGGGRRRGWMGGFYYLVMAGVVAFSCLVPLSLLRSGFGAIACWIVYPANEKPHMVTTQTHSCSVGSLYLSLVDPDQ